MADTIKPGFEQDGFRFVGGDPSNQRNWEPVGLKIGTVDGGYRYAGGDPSDQKNWEDVRDPGLLERAKQGLSSTTTAGQIAATDDPARIAALVADEQRTKLPATPTQRKMAEEIKPLQDEYQKSEGLDAVGVFAKMAAKRLAQFVSNPSEFAGAMVENLPNSAPGMAGGLAGAYGGAAAGSVVAPGPGTVAGGLIGSVAGGTAGGYFIEQGAAMRDQILKAAQERGVDPSDAKALEPIIKEQYDTFLKASRLKGLGTAGTDAALNAVTLGLAGTGERVLAKEAKALTEGVKAGTVGAEQAATQLAGIEARQAARNTIPAQAVRGTGIIGAEMAGEGLSEAAGQKLAYGQVDALDVIDESLMGLGQGGAMSAGRNLYNKAMGAPTNDVVANNIQAAQAAISRQREDAAAALQASQDAASAAAAATELAGSVDQLTAAATSYLQPFPVTQNEADARLAAAVAQREPELRREIFAPHEAITDQLQRSIETNNGVTTAPAAQILDNASVGVPANQVGQGITPYDRVTGSIPTPSPIEVPFSPTLRNADDKRVANVTATNNESWTEQTARNEANQQQAAQQLDTQIAQANQAPAAPAAASVMAAFKTPAIQRTAEQISVLRQAEARMPAQDLQLLQRAATAPFALNTDERSRLRQLSGQQQSRLTAAPQEMQQAAPAQMAQSTEQNQAPVQATPLMGERVANALGLPSNGRLVNTNAKLSTSRPGPGGTYTLQDGVDEAGNPIEHTYKTVDPGKLGGTGRLLTQVARIFGKRLVAFQSDTLKADGFVLPDNNTDIHINVDSGISPLAVFGHELMHLLKRDNPTAYAAVEAVIKRGMTKEQWEAFKADYGQDATLEELASDLMGNRFQESGFWADVFAEIAAQNPEGAAGVIARLGKTLSRAIDSFLKAVNKSGFKADEILGDVTAVRAALKTAMVEYAQQQRNPAIAMEAGVETAPVAKATAGEPAPREPFFYSPEMQGNKRELPEPGVPLVGTDQRVLASRRRADFTDPEQRQEVSTTTPKPAPKKGRLSNSYDEKWVIDGQDVRASEKHVAAVLKALKSYNTLSGKGNAEALMRELHEVVVDNLLWLHDMVPAEVRERAKLWYDGANRIANDWSGKYGVTPRQASGVLAVLSPQMDWFKNVSLGERVITIWKNRQNEPWSQAMTDWVQSWVNAATDVDTKASRQAVLDEVKPLQGTPLSEMDLRQASLFVRVFDETYHERQYRLVTPEGGFGDYVTKSDDGDASVTWGGFDTIAKAISVLDDGSFRNIDQQLGSEHKVRNFFNNILSPNSADGHVTIDTHAVAAAFIKGLAGSSREVADNFGQAGGNAETGASGTYGLFADAYRDAAAQRGVLPREMQSITWEAVRALFPAANKKVLAPKIEAIWDRFKKGEITRDQARDEVHELAGGIRSMAWEGSDAGTFAADGSTSFNTDLAADQAARAARTLPAQVAKDKVAITLSANTDSIPGVAELQAAAAKGNALAHQLLQDVALDNLRHLLAGTSAVIKSDGVTGLYGGAVETSISATLSFADTDRKAVLAAVAKFAENFNQEQIHVRRGTSKKVGHAFADGSYATPVYRWDLKSTLSRKQIENVISGSGLYGLTFGDDFVEAYYVGDPKDEQAIEQFYTNAAAADRLLGKAGGKVSRAVAQLWPYGRGAGAIGYDTIRGDVSAGSGTRSETAKRVAEYLNNGGKVKAFDQVAEITPEQSKLQAEIAQVYESLPDNDLKNPNVRKAYTELAKEVIRQFKALPVKVEVMTGQGEPYANSAAMRRDILDNNHIFIFGTTPETFGPAGADFTGHPLLEKTGLKDQNGYELLYNDLLRAVHDYYAHAMSPTQFGPKGEEAAWKNHMAMTPNMWARWALTAETRGQNSWVNFREGAQDLPITEREFARQKAVLLPVKYSLTGDRTVDKPMKEFIAKLGERVQQGTKPTMRGPGAQLSRTRQATAEAEYAEVERKYKGTPFWLKAPNGKATKLTERQWVQVRTPSFKEWFGDWEKHANAENPVGSLWSDENVSKVVDANGEPLIVYHGSNRAGFSVFKEPGGSGRGDLGIFATPDLEMAKTYMTRRAGEVQIENDPLRPRQPSRQERTQGYYAAFMNLRNPLESDFEGATWSGERPGQYVVLDADGVEMSMPDGKMYFDSMSDAVDAMRENGGDRIETAPDHYETTDSVVQEARSGNDGAIIRNVIDSGSGVHNMYAGEAADVFVALKPNQLKSASQNTGEFSSESDDIRYSKQRIVGESKRQYTPEQLAMFKNTGRTVEEPTLKERIAELRKDLGKKIAQGMFDQFRPIKDLSEKAYALARLSKGSVGAFETLLYHGKLSLKDGVYDGDMSGGFIDRVGKPLQGELEDFLWWVAANRADRLSQEDRENLFTADDIAAGKSLDNGTADFDYTLQHAAQGKPAGTVTRDRTLIYRDALKTFDEFNKNAMDMAEQSGLIDAESRKFWEHEFYVPFYRVADEDGAFVGGKIKTGLVRQEAFKRLKGGTDKLNSDLLANTLSNWGHLLDAAAKNRAAQATLETAQALGIAVESNESTVRSMAKSSGQRNHVVWFQDQGVKRFFLVEDPMLMVALTSLEYSGMRGPMMDAMSQFKHWLTIGVTASPAFKIRNLVRDSMQAVATAPLSYNVAKNIREGIKASDRSSQTYVSALASGGLIRFGTMLEGKQSDHTRRLIRAGVKDATILDSEHKVQAFYEKYLAPGIEAYNELGNRGEEINRASLFKQLQDQGVDQATAALMARDLMDFSMQGSWATVRFLTQVVPFMNARLQGLYKLGKSAQEDPRRFGVVLGAVALASIALMAAYHDDDDWKKREDWDRNNNWWFKFGGKAFRIPKPFEIGAIATLAERGLEYFTSKEMTGKRLWDNYKKIFLDNLSMNPIPQAVKPIIDIYANKDSFTGRPIETMGMERKASQYRYTSQTSMVARGLSTATAGALSPVQYDHVLRGYFSWLGSLVIGTADIALRPLANEPARPERDMWKTATQGIVQDLGSESSRYVTQMYDQAKEVEEAYNTWRGLIKEGRGEEARDYLKDNNEKIRQYRRVEDVKRTEAKFNERIRMIERSALEPGEKRKQIEELKKRQDFIARRVAPGYGS